MLSDVLESLGSQWDHQTVLQDLLEVAAASISDTCRAPAAAILLRESTGTYVFHVKGPLSDTARLILQRCLERMDWRYGEYRDWSWIRDGVGEGDRLSTEDEFAQLPTCVTIPVNQFSDLPGIIGLFYSVSVPDADRQLLEQLAVMLSFAAKRCWLYQRERQITRRLQDARQEANELKRKYKCLVSLQQQFSDTSLIADGFDPVLGRLGEWLKVPIVLLDKEFRLLASYTPNVTLEAAWVRTLEERQLDAVIADRSSFQLAVRQAQSSGNRPLAVESSPYDPKELYWLAGMNNGFHVWGYLLWRGPLPPLSDETVHIIQMAGVALTMVYYGQYEQTLRQQPSFLEAFLAGHYASVEAASELARLEGCNIDKMNRLLIVEPAAIARSITELRNMAQGAVRGLGYEFYAGIYNGSIVILLENCADEKKAANKVFERVKASDAEVLIGISRKFRDIGDMRDAYDQARRSLALFRKRGERKAIVQYDALGVYRLLLNTERAELEDMAEKALGPLLGLEEKQSDELLSTLLHYIRTGGSIQQAAEQCYVHINTVKYRLKRITQLLGADLSSPDVRFKLEVALRAMEILEL